MINLFRKIRQQLLSKNRVTRYIAYALGEIFLVVIGILIALQVNNWNQGRLENIEAGKIKKSIHAEFNQNKILIEEARRRLQIAFDTNLALLDLVGTDIEKQEKNVIDSLIYFSLDTEDFLPGRNTIDNAIQAGKINNDELQTIIFKWGTDLELFKAYKNAQGNWQNQFVVPYLIDNVSLVETESFGKHSWVRKSKIGSDYKRVFQDLRFENLLDNQIWLLNSLLIQLKEIEDTQVRILELTK